MFDNEAIWFIIAVAVILSVGSCSMNKSSIEQEKTKQAEIQLKIEMVKAGITNSPAIHLEKP